MEVEPESSRTLHRLLCRPVSHMWQETPEQRARAGEEVVNNSRVGLGVWEEGPRFKESSTEWQPGF
jgi:hypothetical protein